MNKKLEALQKKIKATEESRKQFIAKFESQLQTVNSDIESCEASIQQALSNEDFDQFEAVTDRLTILKKKKAHFEEGLQNAETTPIGNTEEMENAIRQTVTETAMGYRKELVQYTEAMLKVSNEIEKMRIDANELLCSIESWSDRPIVKLGLDHSAGVSRWASAASQADYYVMTVREHPEWSKMK